MTCKLIDRALFKSALTIAWQSIKRTPVGEIYVYFIRPCLSVYIRDILFSDLYNYFAEDPVGKCVYLQCLEPYILADK